MVIPKPVLLIILDGWGFRRSRNGNAIALAKTPTFDWLDAHAGKTILKASGEDVGLPRGYQGNSEVGHLNIGAGRVVKEMMTRINASILDKSFYSNPALVSAVKHCKQHGSALHIMGLVQNEGVHALTKHAIALLLLAKTHKLPNVWIHFFTDGRDTQPKSAACYVKELVAASKKLGIGTPATLMGRYYAMDRDARWDRTKKAFDAIAFAKGTPEEDPLSSINHAYYQGQADEFILPRVFPLYSGVCANDSVIFFNYRLDRARQLTHSLTDSRFSLFSRRGLLLKEGKPLIHFAAMTRYYDTLQCPVAFESNPMKNILGEVISRSRLTQLRVAETEKYAHVTYFFNGEEETPFPGEDRIMISSPKVATYDLKPDMSALGITKVVLKAIEQRKHDVIIMNFANPDMVGHTGDLLAVIQAVECVDRCVGKLVHAVDQHCGATIITADHGNCEEKKAPFETSHTINPVPFYLIWADAPANRRLTQGRLADVAPTLLKILGIKKPKEMTGNALFQV